MTPITTDLLRILTERLGHTPAPAEVVEFLYNGGAVNDDTIRQQVISVEFFRMYAEGDRTARDIEEELAARYEVDRSTVYRARVRYLQAGARKKRGRAK